MARYIRQLEEEDRRIEMIKKEKKKQNDQRRWKHEKEREKMILKHTEHENKVICSLSSLKVLVCFRLLNIAVSG